MTTPRSLSADATARDHLWVRVPVVSATATMAEAQRAAAASSGLHDVYVVGEKGELVGLLPMTSLFGCKGHEPVRHGIEPPSVTVRDDQDQEHVALAAIHQGLAAVPVVNAEGRFVEKSLEQRVAVAFFMPGIVYLADAIGTQTEAIAVRGLSFLHPHGVGLFLTELWTGILLGFALAVPAFPAIWMAFGDPRLAFAVVSAIVIASSIATAVGLAFPLLLSKFGKDPALGSGPLATVIQDVLSLVTHLVVVDLVF